MTNIIDLITQGKIEGFDQLPERTDTTISHIFIFKNAQKVLKIYRRDNEYWNSNFSDLSNGKGRIDFIKEDYNANLKVNPLVYTDLKTAYVHNGIVRFQDVGDKNDELVIIMNQIETSRSFIDSLCYEDISENEFVSIGEQFAVIKNNVGVGEIKPNENWYQILSKRLHDLQIWMENLNFPKQDIEICIQKLQAYTTKNQDRLSHNEIIYSIDGHGENALYHDKKIQFIDILWPSSRWRWTPKEYDIFRLGADIFALTNENKFNLFINGAKKIYTNFNEIDKEFYLLYSAALDSCVLETLVASRPEKENQQEKYYAWFLDRLKIFT